LPADLRTSSVITNVVDISPEVKDNDNLPELLSAIEKELFAVRNKWMTSYNSLGGEIIICKNPFVAGKVY
jgi:hypothetical protein